jgi:hypothetical protein
MNIFGYNLSKVQKETVLPIEAPASFNIGMDSLSLAAMTDLPVIRENRNKDYVDYGTTNLYPEYLKDMFNTSPTHNAIVKTKAQMVVGDGWTYDDSILDENKKIEVIKLLNFIQRDMYNLSLDYQIFGAMAFEIIWSLDFSRVVEVNRIDVSKLRSGKYEDGEVEEWYYKRNWADKREEAYCIPVLDLSNREDHRQILYIPGQMVSNEYYAEPQYIASMDWITLESQVGLYYRSLIENGFNPSLVVKIFRRPASQEERDEIVRSLKATFGGVKNTGKAMVMFSDGKELAPEVTPIEVANVDKQFTVIADQITQKILTGERATTPELFGIAIPGQLGSGDFETKVKCFSKFVIAPDQFIFEQAVNKILKLNGYDIKLKLNPFTI